MVAKKNAARHEPDGTKPAAAGMLHLERGSNLVRGDAKAILLLASPRIPAHPKWFFYKKP